MGDKTNDEDGESNYKHRDILGGDVYGEYPVNPAFLLFYNKNCYYLASIDIMSGVSAGG